MNIRLFLLAGIIFLLSAPRGGAALPGTVEPDIYDVVVVGGGLAAQLRCDPREVPLAQIKSSLTAIGHIVPQRKQ